MSKEKIIRKYTAADIERYWQGRMPAEEMHAMEKAAMDDPFLADALEGYKNADSPTNDISFLREQLAERTGGIGKVIRMPAKGTWWKVAALVIGLAGVGYAAIKLLPGKNKTEIAKTTDAEKKQNITTTSTDSATDITVTPGLDFEKQKTLQPERKPSENESVLPTTISDSITAALKSGDIKNDIAEHSIKDEAPQLKSTPVGNEKKTDTIAGNKDFARIESLKEKENEETNKKEPDDRFNKSNSQNDGLLSGKKENTRSKAKVLNFTGRVIDNNNNAVPYANVFNLENEKSVLAGYDGYFTIPVEQDSLVLLDVISQGYVSREFRLNRFDKRNNTLTLYPEDAEDEEPGEIAVDAELYDPLLLKNEKTDFPEPEHGWLIFKQYLANNLTRNKESLMRGTVILSFSVNKTGRPALVQVVRSLSKECDNEAMRLLKEGPRWIVKGKSNEIKLSVHFR